MHESKMRLGLTWGLIPSWAKEKKEPDISTPGGNQPENVMTINKIFGGW